MDEIVLGSARYAPAGPAAKRVPVEVDPELDRQIAAIPDKLAFKIGEVADLVGVKAYVLRYWETEFDVLRPKKSKHNQRMYERRDVENLLLIKKLLYRDRFSIEGARHALKRLKHDTKRAQALRTVGEHVEEAKDRLLDLIDEIHALARLVK